MKNYVKFCCIFFLSFSHSYLDMLFHIILLFVDHKIKNKFCLNKMPRNEIFFFEIDIYLFIYIKYVIWKCSVESLVCMSLCECLGVVVCFGGGDWVWICFLEYLFIYKTSYSGITEKNMEIMHRNKIKFDIKRLNFFLCVFFFFVYLSINLFIHLNLIFRHFFFIFLFRSFGKVWGKMLFPWITMKA